MKLIVQPYPIEIIDKIAYYLTDRQKGVCQSVCRSWRNLFVPSQYRHIQIKGKRQFRLFYQALQSTTVGHYVKNLSIQDVYLDSQELESLPFLCPNLVSFAFKSMCTPSSTSLHAWKHLRRLTELGDHLTITHHLLSFPLSPLTHLSIRLHAKQAFFTRLQTATALISLSLDTVTLSFTEIQNLHQSCPYLQNLTLINATLEPMPHQLVSLEPARYMTSFAYQNGHDLHDNCWLLYYLSAKYTHLVSLELWCAYSMDDTGPHIDQACYRALANIGMSCKRLKSLKLLNVPMNHWLLEAMDMAGTRLDHLSISDMTDTTLDMLYYLAQSRQNVSSLTLWGWPSLCIEETLEETIDVLGRCSNRLVSLTVSMQFSGIKNSPVSLDRLLDRCTRLRYLKLDSLQPVTKGRCPTTGLEHFVLEHGCFRNELLDHLAVQCPNLRQLEIRSCAVIDVVRIQMPRLERLCIDGVRPHAKVQDMTQFVVSVAGRLHHYELKDYESYSPSLCFEYEQRRKEMTRPTRYLYHGQELPASDFVYIQCQHVNELYLGSIWIN